MKRRIIPIELKRKRMRGILLRAKLGAQEQRDYRADVISSAYLLRRERGWSWSLCLWAGRRVAMGRMPAHGAASVTSEDRLTLSGAPRRAPTGQRLGHYHDVDRAISRWRAMLSAEHGIRPVLSEYAIAALDRADDIHEVRSGVRIGARLCSADTKRASWASISVDTGLSVQLLRYRWRVALDSVLEAVDMFD